MTLDQWFDRWQIPQQARNELMLLHTAPDAAPGATSEAATQSQCRLAAPRLGFTLWRNNNGAAVDDTGRHIRYGLGNDSQKINGVWKSSDLIGVGPNGRIVAVEVKRPGWSQPENDRDRAQLNFLTQVNALGGIGFFCTHVDQYIERLNHEKSKA